MTSTPAFEITEARYRITGRSAAHLVHTHDATNHVFAFRCGVSAEARLVSRCSDLAIICKTCARVPLGQRLAQWGTTK